jgi:RimJ/RimL family protein N-acetyltransferase
MRQAATQWETDRLILRRFRHDDFDALYELHSDPEAMRFLGGAWTPEKTRETLERIIANYARTDLDWHAVERRSDGAVMGVCWLGRLGVRWEVNLGPGLVELGYRYAKRFWGQGYATEAGAAMLRRGFEELKLPRIVAIVDVLNVASERVIQKLGMQYRKTFEQEGMTIKFYTIDQKASRLDDIWPTRKR